MTQAGIEKCLSIVDTNHDDVINMEGKMTNEQCMYLVS